MSGHGRDQLRSTAGRALRERLRSLTAGLPEVVEALDGFGHTSFRVRKRSFVILGQGGDAPSLSIKADRHTQAHLIRHTAFVRSPYIGQHGWVTLSDATDADWEHVAVLVRDAYRLAAPRTLVRSLEEADEPA